jgi:hypothetical protein
MISGYYVIKDGDKEIARTPNLVTNIGKRHILNYLADKIADRGRFIAIGIGSTAANVADSKLEFEVNKYKVFSSSIDFTNSTIIMKAELPLQLAATISEVGLFPGSTAQTQYDSKALTYFNNDVVWTAGSYIESSANSKINNTSFQIASTNGAEVIAKSTNLTFDFSGYSVADSFSLAFYQNNTNLQYIDLYMYKTDSDYYKYRIPGGSAGHRIVNIPMSDIVAGSVGSPNEYIAKFGLAVKANTGTSTTVDFDGLRINDNDTNIADHGIISRAVLGTPITKEFGRILDIEYRLVVS